ncbi:hypothetical protein WNY78_07225 [Psychroserpens sp. AS72]|uniref:hypothetical protein n=1 Tax=Psychroserpens sp. AS72 TaxID=3135775 RepID=UPI0031718908
MLIATIKSNRFPELNNLNNLPIFGGTLIACAAMLPMFAIQELAQVILGKSQIFDLSVTFFLNNLLFHLFLIIAFDIRIRLFFIPSTMFCLICMIYNYFREYDLIVSILNS